MRLKEGVNPHGTRPELVLGLNVADRVYAQQGVDLVVVSLNDGHHSEKSLHWSGQAADLRTRNIHPPLTAEKMRVKLIEAFGKSPHYDVVLERDHIHLEYQPKG